MGRAIRVERIAICQTPTVVHDAQVPSIGGFGKRNGDPRRTRVLTNVDERLMQDRVELKLDELRKRSRWTVEREIVLDSGTMSEGFQTRPEGLLEARLNRRRVPKCPDGKANVVV